MIAMPSQPNVQMLVLVPLALRPASIESLLMADVESAEIIKYEKDRKQYIEDV
jgi:hypothetical protein